MKKDILEFKTLGIMSFRSNGGSDKPPKNNIKIGLIVLALFILLPLLILWLKS